MTDKEIEEFKQMYLDPKVKIKNICARFFITESKVRYLANKYGLNSNRKDLKSEMMATNRDIPAMISAPQSFMKGTISFNVLIKTSIFSSLSLILFQVL